jgi:dTDP-4-amino-4,6-dideoxygalactose transaminase
MEMSKSIFKKLLTLIDANRGKFNYFEQNLESYFAGHIAVLNSGTAAIHLGLIL